MYFSQTQLDELDERALQMSISRAELVRRVIDTYLGISFLPGAQNPPAEEEVELDAVTVMSANDESVNAQPASSPRPPAEPHVPFVTTIEEVSLPAPPPVDNTESLFEDE